MVQNVQAVSAKQFAADPFSAKQFKADQPQADFGGQPLRGAVLSAAEGFKPPPYILPRDAGEEQRWGMERRTI
jgi:hypothetical protein